MRRLSLNTSIALFYPSELLKDNQIHLLLFTVRPSISQTPFLLRVIGGRGGGRNGTSLISINAAVFFYKRSCKALLNFIRPCENKIFNIHDEFDTKLLNRLRLGLSQLREHNFDMTLKTL